MIAASLSRASEIAAQPLISALKERVFAVCLVVSGLWDSVILVLLEALVALSCSVHRLGNPADFLAADSGSENGQGRRPNFASNCAEVSCRQRALLQMKIALVGERNRPDLSDR